MPFTLSHIALALPLKKAQQLSFTGLVVGSIVPDFEFYIQLKEGSQIGHTILGVLVFNLPLAIIICIIFHLLLRNLLIIHLPKSVRAKLLHNARFDWVNYMKMNKLKLVISILLGCVMHIVVDQFTHEGSTLSIYLPLLNSKIDYLNRSLNDILQLLLSMIGLYYVLFELSRGFKLRLSAIKSIVLKPYWIVLMSTTASIFLLRLSIFPSYNSFWGIIIASIGSVLYAWIITSIFFIISINKPSKK